LFDHRDGLALWAGRKSGGKPPHLYVCLERDSKKARSQEWLRYWSTIAGLAGAGAELPLDLEEGCLTPKKRQPGLPHSIKGTQLSLR